MTETPSARATRMQESMRRLAEARIATERRFQETGRLFRQTDRGLPRIDASTGDPVLAQQAIAQ